MIPDDIRPDSGLLLRLSEAQQHHDAALDLQREMRDPHWSQHYQLNTRIELANGMSRDKTVAWQIQAEIKARLAEIVDAAVAKLADKVDEARDALNLDISIRKDLRDVEPDLAA